ncbi:MAG: 2,3-bisphosphoglycerate-independent phosphoglycerate mutase [Clostridiales bacterium]|nr:2,3-bisphosphoglycerate-independent phosphoglycerate mutase [Clostridiales bacterium]
MRTPYALIIMDGYGINPDENGNAIVADGSKYVNQLIKNYPSAQLGASGMSVGLPDGQMGNSEVGHLNIGAGRIVYQDLTKITKDIRDGEFFKNTELLRAMHSAKNAGKKLHLFGLVSTGGVHSHVEHLYALVEMAKKEGLDNVYIHAFTDGRDVAPTSGASFVSDLQNKLDELNFGVIASVAGRYYAMDRDNNWDREEKAYDMLTLGTGVHFEGSAKDAINASYENGVTDEFILPTNLTKNGKPVALIGEGDSIICFNFRPDRARQISRMFSQKTFPFVDAKTGATLGFERKTGFLNPTYVGFAVYDSSFENVGVAFPPDEINNTLPQYIASLGMKQLHIAETEKYAHVTFFFNAKLEPPVEGETRIVIPSPKVATYDLQPEMSAYLVTDKVLEELDKGEYDVVILNFANCDMVGHTGVMEAAVKAVHTVDECVKKVTDKILAMGGSALVTADHGNADQMIAEDGKTAFTQHTTFPVPVILVSENLKGVTLREDGVLADLAPTLLDMMQVPQPKEMTGKSLIK